MGDGHGVEVLLPDFGNRSYADCRVPQHSIEQDIEENQIHSNFCSEARNVVVPFVVLRTDLFSESVKGLAIEGSGLSRVVDFLVYCFGKEVYGFSWSLKKSCIVEMTKPKSCSSSFRMLLIVCCLIDFKKSLLSRKVCQFLCSDRKSISMHLE